MNAIVCAKRNACICWVLIALSALFSSTLNCKAEGRILLSLPLTGPSSSYGVELRNAFEFFSDRLKGKASIVTVDDKCDPKEAIMAIRSKLSQDQFAAVVGVPCSSVVLAIAPIVRAKGVPLISLGAMSASITDLPGAVFRVGIRDTKIAEKLSLELAAKNRVAALVEQTEFAESVFRQMKQIAPKAFNSEKIDFAPGQTDFASIALRLGKNKPDGLLVSVQSPQSLALIIGALSKAGEKSPVFTGIFAESPVFRRHASQRSMVIHYTTTPTRESCREQKTFTQFESKFGSLQSNDFTLIAADIGSRFLAGLFNGSPVNEAIQTDCGEVSFDENGDMVGMDLALVKLEPTG